MLHSHQLHSLGLSKSLVTTMTGLVIAGLIYLGLSSVGHAETSPSAEHQVHMRVDVSRFTSDDWSAFERGVEQLKGRDLLDPTSWIYQANVHHVPSCTHNGATLPGCQKNIHDRRTWPEPVQKTWAVCPHGDLMFLSWHRLYVFYMERLLRQASGDPSFTLPYWNYSPDNEASRRIPARFHQPQNPGNPLFVNERSSVRFWLGDRGYFLEQVNAGVPVDQEATRSQRALRATNWFNFSNEVENSPHNQMHISLGGFLEGAPRVPVFACNETQKCGWMASIATAGRDPVFWFHHANIDRLWNQWLRQPGRENPEVDQVLRLAWESCGKHCAQNPSYLRQMCGLHGHQTLEACRDQPVFTFFDAGPRGEAIRVSMSPREMVRISFQTTETELGYRYDDEAQAFAAASLVAKAVDDPESRALGNAPSRVTIQMDESLRGDVQAALATLIDEDPGHQAIFLRIQGIESTGEGAPLGSYEIYLNLPDRSDLGDPDLWQTADPYYVGSISFFGLTGGDGHHALNYLADITELVVAQKAAGTWTGEMDVTFVPKGPHPETPAIQFEAIEAVIK